MVTSLEVDRPANNWILWLGVKRELPVSFCDLTNDPKTYRPKTTAILCSSQLCGSSGRRCLCWPARLFSARLWIVNAHLRLAGLGGQHLGLVTDRLGGPQWQSLPGGAPCSMWAAILQQVNPGFNPCDLRVPRSSMRASLSVQGAFGLSRQHLAGMPSAEPVTWLATWGDSRGCGAAWPNWSHFFHHLLQRG